MSKFEVGEELHPGKRFTQIVKIKPEYLEVYKRVHEEVWPEVRESLRKHHFEDYSIHFSPEFNLLIGSFKYTGSDWDKDAESSRTDPANFKWWELTDKMQETIVEGSSGSRDKKGWWVSLEEVFRFDH